MKRVVFAALIVAIWVVIGEGILGLARLASPAIDRALLSPRERAAIAPWLADPQLEKRGNPAYPDHDAAGFRNPHVLEQSDVVALGDSQTYGTSVERHEAWPQVLSETTARPVYNMAFPGWGPLHAEALLPEALERAPAFVLLGVYLGNDFYDAFRLVWPGKDGAFAPGVRERIEDAEAAQTLDEKVERVLVSGLSAAAPPPAAPPPAWRRFLSDHSNTYGLARAIRDALRARSTETSLANDFDRAVAGLTADHRHCCSVYDSASWRTILTAPYRHAVLDADDPRIRLGFDTTLEAIGRMDATTRAAGARLVVVVIPTKESIFSPRIADADDHPQLRSLVETERVFRAGMREALERRAIPFVDLTDALRGAAEQPYFENADGHPSPHGHRLIARTIAARLDALARP